MFTNSRKLHFSTDQAYNGLAAVAGIMHAEKDRLVLEYQVKDNLFGVLKSKTRKLVIPYKELSEVTYKINWFISRFRLHVNSMEILGEFPASKDGVISLKIKRKQKQAAKELESYINLRLSEIRIEMMGEDPSFMD